MFCFLCFVLFVFGCVHVFFAVSMTDEDGKDKVLASMKNTTADRYWDVRWQREWETKYHDPLVVNILKMKSEIIAEDLA